MYKERLRTVDPIWNQKYDTKPLGAVPDFNLLHRQVPPASGTQLEESQHTPCDACHACICLNHHICGPVPSLDAWPRSCRRPDLLCSQWEQRLATMRALNRRYLTVPREFGTHNARDKAEMEAREKKVWQ